MAKGFTQNCKHCDTVFWRAQRGGIYCSRSCSNRAHPERNLGKKHSEKTREKIKRARALQTLIMGSPIKGKHHSEKTKQLLSKQRKGKPTTQSAESRELARKRFSGSNNPNWKGGITNQDKLERGLFRKKLQSKVFLRDNYTCQICYQ